MSTRITPGPNVNGSNDNFAASFVLATDGKPALAVELVDISPVSIQASPTGAFTYGHMSTPTTTTFKSGAGTLHNVSVNTLGTVASTATIYDSLTGSGAIIGIINTLNLAGSFILDVAFTIGLNRCYHRYDSS